MKNNFHNLSDEEESHINPNQLSTIKANVWSSLGMVRAFGDVLDIYLPKLRDFFIVLVGGKGNDGTPPNIGKQTDDVDAPAPGGM